MIAWLRKWLKIDRHLPPMTAPTDNHTLWGEYYVCPTEKQCAAEKLALQREIDRLRARHVGE